MLENMDWKLVAIILVVIVMLVLQITTLVIANKTKKDVEDGVDSARDAAMKLYAALKAKMP